MFLHKENRKWSILMEPWFILMVESNDIMQVIGKALVHSNS